MPSEIQLPQAHEMPQETGMRKKITIMTPCYNEVLGVRDCYLAVRQFFTESLPSYDYEHLFIDNDSRDKTVEILREIAASDKKVKVIVNSRNFGPNKSPYHAILESTGDAVVPVVCDLQTPVDTIREFVRLWEQGYDMVLGLRVGMSEARWLRIARDTYYRIMTRLSHLEHYHGFIGFGLFDRKAVDAMRHLADPNPYFRSIISEIGFRKAFVDYIQPLRKHGKSRIKIPELIDYAILGMVSSSKVPLRIMTMVGLSVSILSFLVACAYLVLKLLFWDTFAIGFAPLLVGMFFLAAIQITCLGLLGEYIGVVFDYVRRRPLVFERERMNFDR